MPDDREGLGAIFAGLNYSPLDDEELSSDDIQEAYEEASRTKGLTVRDTLASRAAYKQRAATNRFNRALERVKGKAEIYKTFAGIAENMPKDADVTALQDEFTGLMGTVDPEWRRPGDWRKLPPKQPAVAPAPAAAPATASSPAAPATAPSPAAPAAAGPAPAAAPATVAPAPVDPSSASGGLDPSRYVFMPRQFLFPGGNNEQSFGTSYSSTTTGKHLMRTFGLKNLNPTAEYGFRYFADGSLVPNSVAPAFIEPSAPDRRVIHNVSGSDRQISGRPGVRRDRSYTLTLENGRIIDVYEEKDTTERPPPLNIDVREMEVGGVRSLVGIDLRDGKIIWRRTMDKKEADEIRNRLRLYYTLTEQTSGTTGIRNQALDSAAHNQKIQDLNEQRKWLEERGYLPPADNRGASGGGLQVPR